MRVWTGKKAIKPFEDGFYEFQEGSLCARGTMNISNTFQNADSTDINYRQAILLYWRYTQKIRGLGVLKQGGFIDKYP